MYIILGGGEKQNLIKLYTSITLDLVKKLRAPRKLTQSRLNANTFQAVIHCQL